MSRGADADETRRRRLAILHRLSPASRAATPEEVASSVVALHSTDPASVHLAVAARTAGGGASVDDVHRALHDDRTVVRVMGMRRTIWVVPADLVPVVAAACGAAVAAAERRKVVDALEGQGIAADGRRWLADAEEKVLAALSERGSALTTQLTADVPALQGTIRFGGDSKWAAEVGLGSRVVLLLSCEGRIVRTRPVGSWVSTQHRYEVAPSAAEPLDLADAQAELARRWLGAFGPASVDRVRDLAWWAGWTVAATRRALAAADGVDVDTDTGNDEAGPWAALLPALDPTTMGWKDRGWYLGDLAPQLFDRNGNAGPTIWWQGRIVGGWSHRQSGEVATRLLVDVGREGVAAVEAETARLQQWLDASGAVVKPRFPTPLQRELSA